MEKQLQSSFKILITVLGSASIIENPALLVAQQSNQMRASSSALHLAQNDRKKLQSPFQQANDRSQQILDEENAIKKGKRRKKDINEMKLNSQNGRSTSEIRVRGNENGGFDVRIDISEIIAMQKQKREMQKKRSQTPGVKQMTSQTKPGELRSESIKKLFQFDERDLDKFALPVTADIIRIPAGGKWTMLRPDGIIHLNQVEKPQLGGVTMLDEYGKVIEKVEDGRIKHIQMSSAEYNIRKSKSRSFLSNVLAGTADTKSVISPLRSVSPEILNKSDKVIGESDLNSTYLEVDEEIQQRWKLSKSLNLPFNKNSSLKQTNFIIQEEYPTTEALKRVNTGSQVGLTPVHSSLETALSTQARNMIKLFTTKIQTHLVLYRSSNVLGLKQVVEQDGSAGQAANQIALRLATAAGKSTHTLLYKQMMSGGFRSGTGQKRGRILPPLTPQPTQIENKIELSLGKTLNKESKSNLSVANKLKCD
ncbi:MAG: hypothetical protein EZS28_011575 [Streblomastix strix]|uniref:Uncharacterized protein n=1 Tax=Streblomastix strix TaxID=222440 RepID=A0A5J4WEC5_9EUKA|nr:MAG: hypothetical protein EZS28_011575 [Streblomastix strix]